MLGPADVLALDQYQEQLPLSSLAQPSEGAATPIGKRGRKRKAPLADSNIDEGIARDGGTLPDDSLPLGPQERRSVMPPPPAPIDISGAKDVSGTIEQVTQPAIQPSLQAAPSLDGDHFTSSDQIEPVAAAQSLVLSGMTPGGIHGDYPMSVIMTPHHHGIDQIESIPNLPADQVSSILNGADMDSYANMGYDDGHPDSGGMSERIANDWNDDYDFPPSVGAHVRNDTVHFPAI